jgi:hypothetical protein
MAKSRGPSWLSARIDKVLDPLVDRLIERGLAQKRGGISESALKKVDERLGFPLPEELRSFYRRVSPVTKCPPDALYGFVGFQPAEDPDLRWLDGAEGDEKYTWTLAESLPVGWQDAHVLVIGYTPFGDCLYWTDGLPGRPSGSILLSDHESDDNPVVLGDSFAQWLARYAAYDLTEYAIVAGGIEDLDQGAALAFLEDHLRLNPECSWANERLSRLNAKGE